MISKKLLNFLEQNKAKYQVLEHRIVYTAHDKAATLKVDPKQVAKTVLVKLDTKDYALVLIPANKNLDKKKLLTLVNKSRQKENLKPFKKIDFVTEQWMKKNLKGTKIGATPPFGSLFKLPTFLDGSFIKQKRLIFNAGDYNVSIEMTPAQFMKIEEAIKGSFSMAKK